LGLLVPAVLVLLYAWTFAALGLTHTTLDLQTGAAAASTFFALILAVVTWQYVKLTNQISEASRQSANASQDMAKATKESVKASQDIVRATRESVQATRDMADRMANSVRPMLVPVVNFERMAMPGTIPDLQVEALGKIGEDLTRRSVDDDPIATLQRTCLYTENIGLGPAVNVEVTVDASLQQWSIPPGKAVTRPIAAGAKELVYQWKEGNRMQILEGSLLTITYSDMLGHHFQTTARRALHDWYDIQTRRVDEAPAPRDYTNPSGL